MSSIKINIETQQSFVYSDYFTCNQLNRLKQLLVQKGQKRINDKYFEASNSALILFKSSTFNGPNYAMDIDKALNEVTSKLTSGCN